MSYAELFERSPMRIFERSTNGGLANGQLGAIIGRAGVGKSALLVHVALDRLFRDQKVLHVSLREGAEHVRTFYSEIFEGIARVSRLKGPDRDRALVKIEKGRLVQCYLDRGFGAADLDKAISFTADVMHFVPDLVVVDGFDTSNEAEVNGLAALAKSRNVSIWTSARVDGGAAIGNESAWDTLIRLDPVDTVIELKVERAGGAAAAEAMGLQLDPSTMLLSGEDTWDAASAPPSPKPTDCTVYSGGAPGAEAVFGEAAERFGVTEMNFTFDGHKQVRERGRHMLAERELAAGDVSLVYVSKRLNRTYSEGTMIRRVLQSLWHQVSRAQQVFVVGTILDDGTVTGGTGWSVELARMWHKDLWVYDQEKESWFHWTGERWVAGVAVIESPHFCGTGTRYLTEAGARAVNALYERSFGPHIAG